MRIVVQKYGGSSLATPEHINAVARRIVNAKEKGDAVVVVVSAMGDTTDELLEMTNAVAHNPRTRELGLLLSTGEVISASLLAMAIQAHGFPATALTGSQGGIFTCGRHDKARIEKIDPEPIKQLLARGEIVVVAGYQGQMGDTVAVLGRGGSDASAVALAVVLKARKCFIFSDVAGVFTADPRIVPQARALQQITYEEMLEMAAGGAQIMMGRSIEIARRFGLEIIVGASFEDTPGTLIAGKERMLENKIITAIAVQKNLAKLGISGIGDKRWLRKNLSKALADRQIPLSHVSQKRERPYHERLNFIINETDIPTIKTILVQPTFRGKFASYALNRNLARLTIVGHGIALNREVISRACDCLTCNNIDILLRSHSEISFSMIIPGNEANLAVQELHRQFGLACRPCACEPPPTPLKALAW